MNHLDVRPGADQALSNEAAMAVLWCGFAAEQATHSLREHGSIEDIRDTPGVHQRFEARDISVPVMVLSVVIADLGRRCELREVDVARAVEVLEKPGKVVLFGKPRELPAGFETDIDGLFDPMLGEESEKALGRLLGEPDGVELHWMSRGNVGKTARQQAGQNGISQQLIANSLSPPAIALAYSSSA